jgi:hypothetical protein
VKAINSAVPVTSNSQLQPYKQLEACFQLLHSTWSLIEGAAEGKNAE